LRAKRLPTNQPDFFTLLRFPFLALRRAKIELTAQKRMFQNAVMLESFDSIESFHKNIGCGVKQDARRKFWACFVRYTLQGTKEQTLAR